jgi:ATPase involved in DNA replication initiation
MKNIKEYKNLRKYLADLQLNRLELITDFVIYEYQIDRGELFSRTRNRTISEARRKIAFLARMFYNIEGKIIGKYLNVIDVWASTLIYDAWDFCLVDKTYYEEIQKLMVKLQMYHNVSLKPLI